MAKKAKQTVIIVPNAPEMAGISTSNAKWIRRMEKLEAEGHAEEVESSVKGAREWELPKELIRLPFFRKPRSWTEEEKEEARERLKGVRAAVKARREAEAEEEDEPAPKKKKKAKKKAKKKRKAAPPPVEDDEEEWEDDIEDEDIDEDFDDEEEVVVKKKKKRKRPR